MRLLVVDDDRKDREGIASALTSLGHEVRTAEDGLAAVAALEFFPAAVIITDLMMPRMDGFQLIAKLRSQRALPPTIVLTAFGNLSMAVSTIHDLGVFWFLEKPIDLQSLRVLLERAAAHGKLEEENRELRQELSYRGAIGDLVGTSPQMQAIFAEIRQVAGTNASVLVTGESGTGKELVARAIHSLSPRAESHFVAINCAAMPESLIESELFGHEKGAFTGAGERRAGCLELAEKGTLFLDELGEMPVGMQAKFLRVLEDFRFRRIGGRQEIEADVRVIAATNRTPEDALKEGKLREDLYYRLNVFHIRIPPLRERMGDIPVLAETLIHNINRKHGLKVTGLGDQALSELMNRRWSGNVRELRNVLERAAILKGEGELSYIDGGDRPLTQAAPAAPGQLDIRMGMTIDQAERALIEATLTTARNNKTRAALILGISTKTLHAKLRQYRGTDVAVEEEGEEEGAQHA